MQILRTNGANEDFHKLVELLDENLWALYTDTMAQYVAGNIVDHDVLVVILYCGTEPITCGCLRPFQDSASVELKRMFVKKEYRGKGYSKEIVRELLRWSKEMNFETVCLETGVKQPEAVNLYEKMGFVRTEPYGEYIGNPESICMKHVISI